MGISNMRETEWGFFTAREMSEIDMTPEQKEKADQKWKEIAEEAKAYGGLYEYGKYLMEQEERSLKEFTSIIELALPTLSMDYDWYIQGQEVIGADQWGNQEVIIHFKTIRKHIQKGETIPQALASIYQRYMEELSAYYEE